MTTNNLYRFRNTQWIYLYPTPETCYRIQDATRGLFVAEGMFCLVLEEKLMNGKDHFVVHVLAQSLETKLWYFGWTWKEHIINAQEPKY